MRVHSVDHATRVEAAKAAPALAGSVFTAVTLNEMVALATLFYILLQASYLVWKWMREVRANKAGQSSKDGKQ